MRNLKRALSLAMATFMLLGMMVVGAGAATSFDDLSDKDKIVNTEAVSVLNTLGVLQGRDDGTFDPQGIVTRGEMAKIICVILNGGSDPKLGNATTNTYTDTVGHWAAAYIEYCTNLKILAGYGNGTFLPNATVTGVEAAKMLLVALGYNAEYEKMVGSNWAISVNVLANQNRLYNGLDINPNDGLTRDNAAQMSYNALNVDMVKYENALVAGPNGALTSIPTITKLKSTLLSDKFGGVRVEGVVVRNEMTADNFAGKTVIAISNRDELAKVTHDFGATGTFEVTTDASVLGTSVVLYVKPSTASPNNAQKAVVLGSVIDSEKNQVVTTNKNFDNDAVGVSSPTSLRAYIKDEGIELSNDLTIYVNGKAIGRVANEASVTYAMRELRNSQTGFETKFIDNDNDGITDVIVNTEYFFGKVTKHTEDGISIDTESTAKDYKASKVIGLEDVALNDYVVFNMMGGKIFVAKAETIEGTLETFKDNTSRLKTNLTVDGTVYTFSESANYAARDGVLKDPDDFTDPSYMGKKITLYMDKLGFVAAASDVQGFTDYAYVANASRNNDASGLAGDVRVYVALADGTSASYVVKSYRDGTWVGKPTGALSETGTLINGGNATHAIKMGEVYGYYLTGDGQIELTRVGSNRAADKQFGNTAPIEFNNGESTIYASGLTTPKLTDNDTVFFYIMKSVDPSGNVLGTVESVEMFVGKDKAPSIKVATTDGGAANTSVYTIPSRSTNKAGVAGAVVFEVGQVTSANVLYLYQYVKTNGDNAIYNAVINGEIVKGITLDSKDPTMKGAYTYTMTSKGYYNVKSVEGNSIITGHAALTDSRTLVVTDPITGRQQEVKLSSTTSMAEIDGGDTAIISNVVSKDWVTAVYNKNNRDGLGVYLIDRYAVDFAKVLGVDDSLVKKSNTPGVDFDVLGGITVGQVLSSIAIPTGATKGMSIGRPTTIAEARGVALTRAAVTPLPLNEVLDTETNLYLVVVSNDSESFSANRVQILGTLPPATAPTIGTQPVANVSFDAAADSAVNSTPIAATGTGTITYEWFKADAADKTGAASLKTDAKYTGATGVTLTALAGTLTTAGDHYFFCRVTNTETGKVATTVDSNVLTINVPVPPVPPEAGDIDAKFAGSKVTNENDDTGFFLTDAHIITTAEDALTGGKYESKGAGNLYIAFTAPAGDFDGSSVTVVTKVGNAGYTIAMGNVDLVSGNQFEAVSSAALTGNVLTAASTPLTVTVGDATSHAVTHDIVDSNYTIVGGADTDETLAATGSNTLKFQLEGAPLFAKEVEVKYTVSGTNVDGEKTATVANTAGKLAAITVSAAANATGPVTITITEVKATKVTVAVTGVTGATGTDITNGLTVGTKGGLSNITLPASVMPSKVSEAKVTYKINGMDSSNADSKLEDTVTVTNSTLTLSAGTNFTPTGTEGVDVEILDIEYTKVTDASNALLQVMTTGTLDGQTFSTGKVTSDSGVVALQRNGNEYTNAAAVVVTLTYGAGFTDGGKAATVSFAGGESANIGITTVQSATTILVTIPAGALTIKPDSAATIVVLVTPTP